uniref:Ig-like domain-containing protein n=1 Tax=Anabas testudineus TaxID=64144 RepID=A0A7N6B5S9_ANATE
MHHVKDRLSPNLQLGVPSLLVFHILVFLSSISSCRAQSQLTAPSQPVVAVVGDDIILPCHLRPAEDASNISMEWTRPDLEPRFVHVLHDRKELLSLQHPLYRERTSLFIDELKNGNISLKLSKVKPADEGKYSCFIPKLSQESTVKLVVGTFFPDQPKSSSSSGSSVPVIIIGLIVGVVFILAAVLFVCKWRKNKLENKKHNNDEETQRVIEYNTKSNESEKEPLLEVVGQTDSGHVTPETVENLNEMETQTANNVQTKEDKEETEFKDHETEVQCLMDEEKHREEVKTERETLSDLDMQVEKLKKILKTKERDEKIYEKPLSRLLGQKKDKEKQMSELRKQLEEVDRQREETEKKLQELVTQKEAAEKEKDQEDRELLDTKNDLERQKTELQKQLDKMETLMERIKNEIIVLTEKKMKATKEKEEVVKKVEELEKLKNENFKTAS